MIDVVLLTEDRYINPPKTNDYIDNILLEARLLIEALQKLNLTAIRKSWSDPTFEWSAARSVVFRTTWDYFDRFDEFLQWVEKVDHQTVLINSNDIIQWNMDKHYLQDLGSNGINVVPTIFAEPGDRVSLKQICSQFQASDLILKPAVSGAARHTYRLETDNLNDHESLFQSLLEKESMMVQPFMKNILSFGELSLMVFGGKYSHAIVKKAKEGDFRVQDDFGGTVQKHMASDEEILFAEDAMNACKISPVYGRVDLTYDNNDQPVLMELELVEPELWFRFEENAAAMMANAIARYLHQSTI